MAETTGTLGLWQLRRVKDAVKKALERVHRCSGVEVAGVVDPPRPDARERRLLEVVHPLHGLAEPRVLGRVDDMDLQRLEPVVEVQALEMQLETPDTQVLDGGEELAERDRRSSDDETSQAIWRGASGSVRARRA